MMKCLYVTLLLTVAGFVISCSTGMFEAPVTDSKEVAKAFDLSNGEMEKFKETPVIVVEEQKKEKVIVASTAKPKVPRIKSSKTVKIKKTIASVKKEQEYPVDFPEKLKEYDKKSKELWKKFKPVFAAGEDSTYAISFLGIPVGDINTKILPLTSIGGETCYHIQARLKSAKYYRYIYSLDDVLDSYISTNTLLPIKYSLIQRESKQNIDDLQLFDREKLKTYFFYKRIKKGKRTDKKLTATIPKYFQDSFSAIYFVRGLPLEKGASYQFPIVTKAKIKIFEVTVEGTETIEVNDQDINAYRLRASMLLPGVLKEKEKGKIVFWYSKDKERRLLKFSGKVKIGSIAGELIKYTPGK